jgi:hypothetical protein
MYGVLLALVFIIYLRTKWRRELRMEESKQKDKEHRRKMSFSGDYKKMERRMESKEDKVVEAGPPPEISRQFMYNGHAWDACEVLGVSDDCNADELKLALEKSLKEVDDESQSFFEHAYETLRR